MVYIGFSSIPNFGHPRGVLEFLPSDKGGTRVSNKRNKEESVGCQVEGAVMGFLLPNS